MANLAIVFIYSWLARVNPIPDYSKTTVYKPNFILVFISLTSLVLVSGLRYHVGTDYYMYNMIYPTYRDRSLLDIIGSDDWGFGVLYWLSNQISSDSQVMFFIVALITNTMIVLTLRDFADPFELGMFLYIGTFAYYATFNIMRQYMAASIIFWAVRYLFSGDWKKYFLVVLFASIFHASAVIMIPVYFYARRKAWTWVTLVITLCIFCAFMFYGSFLSILFSLETQYDRYRNVMGQQDGVNALRVLIALAPIILTFIVKDISYRKERDYLINLCFLSFLFMLLSMRHVYYARLCVYFDVYTLLLLPEYVKGEQTDRNRIIYMGLVLCYFMMSYILLPFDGGMLPYRSYFDK